jgi:hypothetical protein
MVRGGVSCRGFDDEAYTTISLMRTRDNVRRSDLWGRVTTKFDKSALCQNNSTRTKVIEHWLRFQSKAGYV